MRAIILGSLVLAACSGGKAADSGYTGGGNSSADAGAGGVSFGGQQDIGEFRGVLQSGGVPGPDTLDANGFFNEHYAPAPMDGCTNTLCLTPGVSVGKDWLHDQHQATLQISINTNVDPTQYPKKPLNLVVVVDHSGSMSLDQRLEKVKAGLGVLIDNLADTDRLAIVEFDDQVQVDAAFAPTLDRAHLHQIVNAMTPRGGTDIYDGLQKGFDLSVASLDPARQNRVIFLSDGMATVGNTSEDAIIAMADGYVSRGIGLTTVGVGLDFDVTLMRGLAEHGAGNFYFLEDAAAATEVFQSELAYFVSPIALDIHIDAVAGTGWDFGDVVGSTLWSSTTRSGTMHVPAAFVASRTGPAPDPTTGGRRGGGSMLFIALHPTGHNTDGKVADLTLNYRLPGTGEIVTQTVTLAYPNDPSQTPAETYLSVPEMAKRYAMYNLYLGLAWATQQANFNCATVGLQTLEQHAKDWNATREDPDILADIQLIDQYIANLATHGAYVQPGTTLDTCAYGGGYGSDNWGDGSNDTWGHDGQYDNRACSAVPPASGALIGLALIAVVRRRRRS